MYEWNGEETGITVPEIEDSKFYKNGNWASTSGYFRIKLLRKLSSLHLSIHDLNDNGVSGNIQGARKIDSKVKKYIEYVSSKNSNESPREEKEILSNMTEVEIEATLNAEDDSACYVYKEGLVKTRKINKEIVDKLKAFYKGQCQLCGETAGKEFGKEIVEAHHIEYFSLTQNNDASNIIIVCPNCHALIHKCNPVYNKKEYTFDFDGGRKLYIKYPGHLKK
jgi:3'-phosphoadenosine 5'-phosphosulfate sulfotransferase (PAPS reductase)/FAD synthetase